MKMSAESWKCVGYSALASLLVITAVLVARDNMTNGFKFTTKAQFNKNIPGSVPGLQFVAQP